MTSKLDMKFARVTGDHSGAPEGSPQDGAPALYTLPIPPSVNAAFANTRRGRVLTQKAKDWKLHAGHILKGQLKEQGKRAGSVVIIANVERPNLSSDIDNRVKLLIDVLVSGGAIDDDKNVAGIAFAWAPSGARLVNVAVVPAQSFPLHFQMIQAGALGIWTLPAPRQPEPEKEAA